MEFYNLKTKKKVAVDDKQVQVVTMKNGRKAGQAEYDLGGGKKMKLYKILGKDDLTRLGQ